MNHEDFTYLNVEKSVRHAMQVIPPTDRYAKVTLTYCKTEIELLRREKLIKPEARAFTAPIEKVVLRLSELTEEGQDFIMSGATRNWLGACDRKSSNILAKGATEEEALAVYSDPRGLEERLAKFRAERSEAAH